VSDQRFKSRYIDLFFKFLIALAVFAGVVTRVIVLLQSRDLFIDEANVARNVAERGLLGLAQPLSYEQYAPPVFLWALKLMTGLLGYGEIGFRLFPLLCAIAAFYVFYLLLRELISIRTLWYPMALMAVSYIMIRYSTEVKQYMSDVLVVLSLILLALKLRLETGQYRKFFLAWVAAGTIAIWAAMPAVFVLAGVGVFYFTESVLRRERKAMFMITGLSLVWLMQFGIYYLLILKPQIESNYLQSFHQQYFLYATPSGSQEWEHNWNLIKNLIQEISGYNDFSFKINTILICIGIIALVLRNFRRSVLVIVPLLLVYLAAALNQYSLIPRVALFTMPLILILIGYGMNQFVQLPWKPLAIAGTAVMLLFGMRTVRHHSMAQEMISKPKEVEPITDGMSFVMAHPGISAENLYLHNSARPAFIYYTQIHPERSRWARIRDAKLLQWDANYEAIGASIQDSMALIISSGPDEEIGQVKAAVEKHLVPAAMLDVWGCKAIVYGRRDSIANAGL